MPVFTETSPARLEHGAGLPGFPRLGFYPEQAAAQLKGASHVLLAGVHEPPTDTTLPSTR
jgi:acetolactate synthase-1/2/3 large subunit